MSSISFASIMRQVPVPQQSSNNNNAQAHDHIPAPNPGEVSMSGMVADLEQAIAQMKDSVKFWTPSAPIIGMNVSTSQTHNKTQVDRSLIASDSSESHDGMNWDDIMSGSDSDDH
jgi:hypothetical protein